MINRKALWISVFLIIAMIAAALWRLSLLPDWHHLPFEGPGSRMIPSFVLFIPPVGALFVIGMLLIFRWWGSGSEEAKQPWRLLQGMVLLSMTGITALAQAFNIAHSLGALQSIDRLTFAHLMFVACGIFMMVVGNIAPKMPWLVARFRPLDPWQWNQQLRFSGKLAFVFGLFFAVVMPLLPIKLAVPVMPALALAVVAIDLWHRAKVRREPSPQP